MSVANDLSAAAASLVVSLNLGVPVRPQERPTRPDGLSDLIAVCVSEDRYEPARADDDSAWYGYYTLLITIFRKGVSVGADATVRQWRQQIRRAITPRTLDAAGLTVVDDVDPASRAAVEMAQLDRNLRQSTVALTVRTLEPRA